MPKLLSSVWNWIRDLWRNILLFNYVPDYLFQKCKSYSLELQSVFIVSYGIAKCIKEIVNTGEVLMCRFLASIELI